MINNSTIITSTCLRETSISASCRLTFSASFSAVVICSRLSMSETLREHSCLIVSMSISQVCSICCSRLHTNNALFSVVDETIYTLFRVVRDFGSGKSTVWPFSEISPASAKFSARFAECQYSCSTFC